MENPWSQIPLSDYEHHMELSPIQQLQTLNAIMKRQFGQTPFSRPWYWVWQVEMVWSMPTQSRSQGSTEWT